MNKVHSNPFICKVCKVREVLYKFSEFAVSRGIVELQLFLQIQFLLVLKCSTVLKFGNFISIQWIENCK